MKRFISFVLLASTFFIAAGAIVNRAGAAFRSDDKALAILARARTAIGGDNVKGLVIVAKSSKSLPSPDGPKTLDADLNIALETSGRLQKTLKAGDGTGSVDHLVVVGRTISGDAQSIPPVPPVPAAPDAPGAVTIVVTKDGKADGNAVFLRTDGNEEGQTVTTDENGNKKIVITRTARADANGNVIVVGGNADKLDDPNAKKIFINRSEQRVAGGAPHGNELLRLTLALLARTPEGSDLAFTYAGESSVDGAACDLVTAATGENGGGITLCFDRGTGLPSSMTYKAPKPVVIRMKKPETPGAEAEQFKVFATKADLGELAEYQVKFADYRTVDGVRLPFSWTQTVAGQADETTTVTEYSVNPADIGSNFKEVGPQKMVFVTKSKN